MNLLGLNDNDLVHYNDLPKVTSIAVNEIIAKGEKYVIMGQTIESGNVIRVKDYYIEWG